MSKDQKTLLKFPCEFPIKIVGYNQDDFKETVADIITKHVSTFKPEEIKTKLSQGNKYLSITATIKATSKKQLDTIYRELNACKLVVMTL